MSELDEVRAALERQPQPVCLRLTPFELIGVDRAEGLIRVAFQAQPAFENHFGNLQAGFAVAMLDVPLSIAGFVFTGAFCPTVELKASYLSPAPIGPTVGEARVLKAGKRLAFLEARLLGPDNKLAIHATATIMVPGA